MMINRILLRTNLTPRRVARQWSNKVSGQEGRAPKIPIYSAPATRITLAMEVYFIRREEPRDPLA